MWIQWLILSLLISVTNAHSKMSFNLSKIKLKEYDGGRNGIAFVKLWSNEKNCIWCDPGFIVDGATLGCRVIVRQPYFNQSWFWGAYMAYDLYAYSERSKGTVYQMSQGVELFGSRFGRLSINVYKLPVKSEDLNALKVQLVDFNSKPWIKFYPLAILDDGGVSIKWSSIPHKSSIQGSIIFARSWIKQRNNGWSTECVNRLGVGLEYILFKQLRIEMQYMFFDAYQKGWHVSIRRDKSSTPQYYTNWLKQFNGPAERHIPIYRTLHVMPPSYGNSSSYGGYANTNNSGAGSSSSYNHDQGSSFTPYQSIESEFAELTHQTVQAVQNCSARQLKKWYHQASLQLHPDKQSGRSSVEVEDANRDFKRLSNCYQTLLKRKT